MATKAFWGYLPTWQIALQDFEVSDSLLIGNMAEENLLLSRVKIFLAHLKDRKALFLVSSCVMDMLEQ